MTYNLAVSPDFKPELISDWFIFNTWIQKQIGISVHLELHHDFNEQYAAIDAKKVDLIYANSYDISRLVRDEGFTAIAKPRQKPDETVIACKLEAGFDDVKSLSTPVSIAQTCSPDVNTIGMIMLEPADITNEDIKRIACANYVGVAKQLLKGEADIGFFLEDAFNDLSPLIKKQLKPVVSSQIHLIHHAFLVGPAVNAHIDAIRSSLLSMHEDKSGSLILAGLGFSAWDPMNQDDAEFIIDLIDTLVWE